VASPVPLYGDGALDIKAKLLQKRAYGRRNRNDRDWSLWTLCPGLLFNWLSVYGAGKNNLPPHCALTLLPTLQAQTSFEYA